MLKDQKGGLLIILSFFIVLILVGAGAYYFGLKQNPSIEPQMSSHATVAPMLKISPPPASSPVTLPPGWSYQLSNECSVSMPLPPKQEPYYIPESPDTPPAVDDEGGWWHYESSSTRTDKFFTDSNVAIFKHPEAASGYISGMVEVRCGPNKNNYSTSQFVEEYSKQYSDGTLSGLTFTNLGDASLWNQKVARVSLTGGMASGEPEYMFATPSKLYKVSRLNHSNLQIIKDITDQIFQNLQFSK